MCVTVLSESVVQALLYFDFSSNLLQSLEEIIIIITLVLFVPVHNHSSLNCQFFPYRLHAQWNRQVLIPGSEVKEKKVKEMALRFRDARNNGFSLNVSAIDFLYNEISISTILLTVWSNQSVQSPFSHLLLCLSFIIL